MPAPWDDTTETRVAAVRAGYRSANARGSEPLSHRERDGFEGFELPWWKSGKGFAMVLAAGATFIGAVTGSVVAIMSAARQPDAANADVAQLKAESEQRQRAAPGQKLLEDAREADRQKQIDDLKSKFVELDLRYPAPRPDPNRSPR